MHNKKRKKEKKKKKTFGISGILIKNILFTEFIENIIVDIETPLFGTNAG